MRTRKIFFHEEGLYDGISRVPESREKTSTEFISLNNPYDEYPVNEPVAKNETSKVDDSIDTTLANEYHLQSPVNKNTYINYHENQDFGALPKESKI